mmetsp:Transcript_19402/g.42216  ORF Transcript_19402/g.42216 Transcript_19402/m.42216 type:complete len:313 (-) Transcript_19402:145-1083(-)
MSAVSAADPTSDATTGTSLLFGQSTLSSSRLHDCSNFLAGDTTVTIIPTFNYRQPLGLISRTAVGPFSAGVECSVPLWLATHLRRRNLCRIVPPSWLDVEVLRSVLKHERDPKEASFSPLIPFRHAEIAKAVLGACSTGSGSGGTAGSAGGTAGDVEIADSDHVRLLLEDIATVRMDKIRRNIHTLSAQSMAREDMASLPVIDVTGIGSLEMHAVMPFITEAFREHRTLTGQDGGRKGAMDKSKKSGGGGGGGSRAAVASASATARRTEESSSAGAGAAQPMQEDDDEEDEDDLEEPTPAVGGGRSRLRRFR